LKIEKKPKLESTAKLKRWNQNWVPSFVKTENQIQTRTDSLKMLGWRIGGSF
jgi:hypothetical protein